MLDTTTDTGARTDKRLREERIAWLTTVRSVALRVTPERWQIW